MGIEKKKNNRQPVILLCVISNLLSHILTGKTYRVILKLRCTRHFYGVILVCCALFVFMYFNKTCCTFTARQKYCSCVPSLIETKDENLYQIMKSTKVHIFLIKFLFYAGAGYFQLSLYKYCYFILPSNIPSVTYYLFIIQLIFY